METAIVEETNTIYVVMFKNLFSGMVRVVFVTHDKEYASQYCSERIGPEYIGVHYVEESKLVAPVLQLAGQ